MTASRALRSWPAGRKLQRPKNSLTPYILSDDAWIAWQFDRPEHGVGVVQAFRREASPYESIRLKLHGLTPEGVYTVTNFDVPGTIELTGRELSVRGLLIDLPTPRSAAVITYQKQR